jgi:hypothetical protein
MKRRPPKAVAPSLSLFIRVWSFRVQNKGTTAMPPNHLARTARLAWDHRRTLYHVFRAPQTYPWRERAKLPEGRVEAAHVGCCVFCVLCVMLYLLAYLFFYYYYYLANQLVEIDLDKGQISKLCSTVNKKPPQKHPDIIICPNMEWFIPMGQNLTLMRELYCGDVKMEQKLYSEERDLAKSKYYTLLFLTKKCATLEIFYIQPGNLNTQTRPHRKHKQHDKHHHHGGGTARPSSGMDLMNPCRWRGGRPSVYFFQWLTNCFNRFIKVM